MLASNVSILTTIFFSSSELLSFVFKRARGVRACGGRLHTIAAVFVLRYLVGVNGNGEEGEGENNPHVSLSSTDRNIALASC